MKRSSSSISGNSAQAEDLITVQVTCKIDRVGEGGGGLAEDFFGLTGVTRTRQDQSFGHGANLLALERFPLTWSSHTFVNPFTYQPHSIAFFV